MPGPQLLYRGAIACPVILSCSTGFTPVRTRRLSRAVILSVYYPGAMSALYLVVPVHIALSLSVASYCTGSFMTPLSSIVGIFNALGIHIYSLSPHSALPPVGFSHSLCLHTQSLSCSLLVHMPPPKQSKTDTRRSRVTSTQRGVSMFAENRSHRH